MLGQGFLCFSATAGRQTELEFLNRARICKPFKKPKRRFPAWRACTTTLFVVPARQAT
jgi:hypothetical protein